MEWPPPPRTGRPLGSEKGGQLVNPVLGISVIVFLSIGMHAELQRARCFLPRRRLCGARVHQIPPARGGGAVGPGTQEIAQKARLHHETEYTHTQRRWCGTCRARHVQAQVTCVTPHTRGTGVSFKRPPTSPTVISKCLCTSGSSSGQVYRLLPRDCDSALPGSQKNHSHDRHT